MFTVVSFTVLFSVPRVSPGMAESVSLFWADGHPVGVSESPVLSEGEGQVDGATVVWVSSGGVGQPDGAESVCPKPVELSMTKSEIMKIDRKPVVFLYILPPVGGC